MPAQVGTHEPSRPDRVSVGLRLRGDDEFGCRPAADTRVSARLTIAVQYAGVCSVLRASKRFVPVASSLKGVPRMSFCKSRRAPGASLSPRASIAAIAVTVLAGGCAATNSGPSRVAGPVSAYPDEAAPRTTVSRAAPVEIEADGLPAQVAPKNRRPMRDDPTEPWSPNYGTGRSSAADEARTDARVAAAPAATRISTQATTPRLHPDDIIRLAIAEHEMQRR